MHEITTIGLNKNVNFKAEAENQNTLETVKSDLVTSPETDEFVPEAKPKKKKHLLKKISLGVLSAITLTYGGIVLHRKLSKPALEEVQKCFREIFQKDLSTEEVNTLIKKYKEICKNNKTEEFTQNMIEQLKKDYGLEQVTTSLNIEKLKDNTLKTTLEYSQAGNASPLAHINIMPRTSEDFVIRNVQGQTFATGFHELKHIKQFAEAYRADPEKFAEAIFDNGLLSKPELKEKIIKDYKDRVLDLCTKLKNGDKETIQLISSNSGVSEKEVKAFYANTPLDEAVQDVFRNRKIKTDEDIFNLMKRKNIEEIKNLLDTRYGKLERFKAGSEEYNRGLEYIEGYRKYPNPESNYDEYRNNILEKEAWDIGSKAEKIYKYLSSIWKM